jgi:hypothetical protein
MYLVVPILLTFLFAGCSSLKKGEEVPKNSSLYAEGNTEEDHPSTVNDVQIDLPQWQLFSERLKEVEGKAAFEQWKLIDELADHEQTQGITYRMIEPIAAIGDRGTQFQSLLRHSYQVIDVYAFGMNEIGGMGDYSFKDTFVGDGDIQSPAEILKSYLEKDYNQFKILFKPELDSLSAEINKQNEEIKNGDREFIVLDDFEYILHDVDTAYKESFEFLEENGWDPPVHRLHADNPILKFRDVFHRTEYYLFGDKIELEDVPEVTGPLQEP